MLANAVRWAAGGPLKGGTAQGGSPRVGVIGQRGLPVCLQNTGLIAAETKPGSWLGFDVTVAEPGGPDGTVGIAAIHPFLEAGGGLDPEPPLKWWDAAFESQATFSSTSTLEQPERIAADRQISAGYIHFGYPIMVPLDDSTTHALNLAKLKAEGSRRHLHELGHSIQGGSWTFDSTGEVTNDLLVVHTRDTLLNLHYDSGHSAIRGKGKRTKRIRNHLTAGAPFEEWKSGPFLALMMYIQLYEGFG